MKMVHYLDTRFSFYELTKHTTLICIVGAGDTYLKKVWKMGLKHLHIYYNVCVWIQSTA